MPAMRAVRPLSGAAVKQANAEFYRSHPEMIVGGQPVPIDPCDPQQAGLRREWMASYAANGGAVEPMKGQQLLLCAGKADQKFLPAPVANPTMPCPMSQPQAQVETVRAPQPPKPGVLQCYLRDVTLTCEHGRRAGPSGQLMVVPSSTMGIGDKITGSMAMNGGCGTHPSWSVGGFWSSQGKGTAFNFNAAKWVPTGATVFALRFADPHVYRIDTAACSGTARVWEISAYPPGGISGKIDLVKMKDVLLDALKIVPMPQDKISELSKKWFQGQVQYSGAWKEHTDWQAYYEMSITGGCDPLFVLSYKGPIYPMTLVPGWLGEWVKAGLFFEVGVAAKFMLGIQGKYWPARDKTDWAEFVVKGGVAGTGALSLELKLVRSEFVEGALTGETGFDGEVTRTGDWEDPEVQTVVKWTGVKGKATIKAAWGIVEYTREFQLLPEKDIWKENLLEGAK